MTKFRALPPSWSALSSVRELTLECPGPLDAAGALGLLGSWTQLTSLQITVYDEQFTPRSLEHQLPRLSALQHLHICLGAACSGLGFHLPPGRWQGQLTSLECNLQHLLVADGQSSEAAVLAHATALRQLKARHDWREPTQPQLRTLLGVLAALPALQRVVTTHTLEDEVHEAPSALGSPLGARLQFD